MQDRRKKVEWRDPAWITLAVCLLGFVAQYGASQARISGVEAAIADLKHDISVIQRVLMDGSTGDNSGSR